MLGPGQGQVKPVNSVFLYGAGVRQVHFEDEREPSSRIKKTLWRLSTEDWNHATWPESSSAFHQAVL